MYPRLATARVALTGLCIATICSASVAVSEAQRVPPAPAAPPAKVTPRAVPGPQKHATPDFEQPLSLHPARPIAGDPVTVWVQPFGYDGDDLTCAPRVPRIRKRRRAKTTTIDITQRFGGACVRISGRVAIELGALRAGSYVVREGGHQLAFDVRPASADPGELPLGVRLRLAILDTVGPEQRCDVVFGDRLVTEWKTGAPLLWRQLARARPDTSDVARARLLERATTVVVSTTAAGAFAYQLQQNGCCNSTQLAGVVTVETTGAKAGAIRVGAPQVVSRQSTPC